MAQPDTSHAGRADLHPLEPQLVGDPLGAVGGAVQSVGEDPLLDLRRDPVGMPHPYELMLAIEDIEQEIAQVKLQMAPPLTIRALWDRGEPSPTSTVTST